MPSSNPANTDHSIVIERVFDAPRPLVWRAYTEAEHIANWLGPGDYKVRVDVHEFREGGAYRCAMVAPDGQEHPFGGTFTDIVEGERVTATDQFLTEPLASDPLFQGISQSATFEDHGPNGRQCKLTIVIRHQSAESKAAHEKMGVVQGFNMSLDKLEQIVAALKA